jgi:serine protease Do
MPRESRNRLAAVTLIALLVLGGTVAGVALRSDAGTFGPASAAARDAVRQASSVSDAFIAIAETVTPAVVRIEVERAGHQGSPLTARPDDLRQRRLPDAGNGRRENGQPPPQLSGGSGFIVSADGYILTNHHVVAGADRITVTLRDRRALPATVVGGDPATDIAVIRIAAQDLPAVALGDSDAARVGEWVIAVGNPGFEAGGTLDFTVTGGIISAKGRPLNILNGEPTAQDPSGASYAIEDFIQTDAVINPGNSGGPLVDLKGTVVGINTAIASTTGYSQGYGFAVPANLARRVMRDLIEYGYVRRPLLGITIADVTQEDAEIYGLTAIAGVVVEDFAPDSPAERSGLRRHDVIVAVAGTPVERSGQLQRLVALHHPGESVTLSVVRYGEPLRLRVQLMEAPGGRRTVVPRGEGAPTAGVGIELEDLTPTLARQLGYHAPGGAVISQVAPASPAHRKEILRYHRLAAVNGDSIRSAEHGRTALRAARSGQILSLLVAYPDGRTYIANVRVP